MKAPVVTLLGQCLVECPESIVNLGNMERGRLRHGLCLDQILHALGIVEIEIEIDTPQIHRGLYALFRLLLGQIAVVAAHHHAQADEGGVGHIVAMRMVSCRVDELLRGERYPLPHHIILLRCRHGHRQRKDKSGKESAKKLLHP